MNIFQQRVLERVARFADSFACLRAIYVFGSVGRGETATANDVDLTIEFVSEDQIYKDVDDFGRFQCAFEEWALASLCLFGRPFNFVGGAHFLDPRDVSWPAVLTAAENPVAVIGRAILVATPRHTPKS